MIEEDRKVPGDAAAVAFCHLERNCGFDTRMKQFYDQAKGRLNYTRAQRGNVLAGAHSQVIGFWDDVESVMRFNRYPGVQYRIHVGDDLEYAREPLMQDKDYPPGEDFLMADPKGIYHQMFKFFLTGDLTVADNNDVRIRFGSLTGQAATMYRDAYTARGKDMRVQSDAIWRRILRVHRGTYPDDRLIGGRSRVQPMKHLQVGHAVVMSTPLNWPWLWVLEAISKVDALALQYFRVREFDGCRSFSDQYIPSEVFEDFLTSLGCEIRSSQAAHYGSLEAQFLASQPHSQDLNPVKLGMLQMKDAKVRESTIEVMQQLEPADFEPGARRAQYLGDIRKLAELVHHKSYLSCPFCVVSNAVFVSFLKFLLTLSLLRTGIRAHRNTQQGQESRKRSPRRWC